MWLHLRWIVRAGRAAVWLPLLLLLVPLLPAASNSQPQQRLQPPLSALRSASLSLSHLDVFLVSVALPPPGRGFGSKAHARVAVAATQRLGRVVQDLRAGSSLPVRLHLLVDHASLHCQRERMRTAFEEAQEARKRKHEAANAQERDALDRAMQEAMDALSRAGISIEAAVDGSVGGHSPGPSPPVPSLSDLQSADRELLRAATATPHPKFCLALDQYTRDVFDCATQTTGAGTDAGQAQASSSSCAPLSVFYHDYHSLFARHTLLRSLCSEFGGTAHTPACLYLAKTVLLDYLPSSIEELVVLDSDMRLSGDLADLHREVHEAEPRFQRAREDLRKQREQEQSRQAQKKTNSGSKDEDATDAAATAAAPLTPDYALDLPVLGMSAEQQLAHAVIAAFDPLARTSGVLPAHRPFSVLSVPRGFNGGLQLHHVALMRSVSADAARPSTGSRYRASLQNFKLSVRYALELGDQTLYSTLNLTQPQLFHELRAGWNRQLCTIYWPAMLEWTAGVVHALTSKANIAGVDEEQSAWPLTAITERECWEAFNPPDVRAPPLSLLEHNASAAVAASDRDRLFVQAQHGVRILHANCASDRRLPDDGIAAHHRALMDSEEEDEAARASRVADVARLALTDASSCHWSREMDGTREDWLRTLHRCMPLRLREARRIDERRRARHRIDATQP